MQDPDINEILRRARRERSEHPLEGTTFFLGRRRWIASDRPGMAMWRERLFAFMSRNGATSDGFLQIPPIRSLRLERTSSSELERK